MNKRKGIDPNVMELLVDNIEINPQTKVVKGAVEDGLLIKFHRYHLDDLLIQLLEDYGEDFIINRIKSL